MKCEILLKVKLLIFMCTRIQNATVDAISGGDLGLRLYGKL